MKEEPNEGKLAFYKGRQAPNEPAVPSGTQSVTDVRILICQNDPFTAVLQSPHSPAVPSGTASYIEQYGFKPWTLANN